MIKVKAIEEQESTRVLMGAPEARGNRCQYPYMCLCPCPRAIWKGGKEQIASGPVPPGGKANDQWLANTGTLRHSSTSRCLL